MTQSITIPFQEILETVKKAFNLTDSRIREETTKRACLFAAESHSYDDCIWLLAEIGLYLQHLYQLFVQKDLKKAKIKKPDEGSIRSEAKKLASYGNWIQDIHWQFAERKLLVELIETMFL